MRIIGLSLTLLLLFGIAYLVVVVAAVRQFWLAALVIFSGRAALTYWGARVGLARAGAPADIRHKTWQGLLSQRGVTLGLVLLGMGSPSALYEESPVAAVAS